MNNLSSLNPIDKDWPLWRKALAAAVLAAIANHLIFSIGRLAGVDYTVTTPQGSQLLSAAQIALFTVLPMLLGAGLYGMLDRFVPNWSWRLFLGASAVAVAFSFVPFFQASYPAATIVTLGLTHLVPPAILIISLRADEKNTDLDHTKI
jgi:hypothetical protein